MRWNNKPTSKDDLLKQLDVLGYSTRMKTMAIMGHDNPDSEQFHALLGSLLEDGVYEAKLALMGAAAAKNLTIIKVALTHPMVSVRKKATALFAKEATADSIKDEIVKMSSDCRNDLLQRIRKTNRQEVAEQLLPLVYQRWGAKEATFLLPVCSQTTIETYLDLTGATINNWKILTYRDPDVVSAYFMKCLEQASSIQRMSVWWKFSSAIQPMCILKSELILDCAIHLGPIGGLHPLLKANLGILVRSCPEQAYQLLLVRELRKELLTNGLPKTVLHNIRCFTTDQIKGLARLLAENPDHIARLLEWIAPSDRNEIFETIYEKETRKDMIFSESMLKVLPYKLRDSEATRMLGLSQIQEDKERKYTIASYQDIDHSRELLQSAANSSTAEKRAEAYTRLIRSTSLSRHGMEETLTFLCRIKNEQDPVRNSVFAELSKCNPALFTTNHIPELTLLVDSILNARDTSEVTRIHVQRFAFALMIQHVSESTAELFQFALSITKNLVAQKSNLSFPSLVRNIPHGLEQNILDEIYPMVAYANRCGNYGMVLQLAVALGKRGEDNQKLQNLLKEAIQARPDYVAMQVVTHWLASKKSRDSRVKELISMDASYIKLPVVRSHLLNRRQEWLDPFIQGRIIKGRYLAGNTIYVMPVNQGFERWLPRQQKSFCLLLEKIAQDKQRSLYERAQCIKVIAKMPDINPKEVMKYIDSAEVPIAEAGLYAASLLQEPEQAISVLMDHLVNEEARVAMYAIPKCIRQISPELCAIKLNSLMQRDHLKITVKKEVIRLIGESRMEGCLPILRSELQKDNPHKDVLIAVGQAARLLLEYEDAWKILDTLAASQQIDIVRSLLQQKPSQLNEDGQSRYVKLIIQIAQHSDAEIRKEAFLSLNQWIYKNEVIIADFAAAEVADYNNCTVWAFAMEVLIDTCQDGKVNSVILKVLNDMMHPQSTEEYNATLSRDLPQRQRLLSLINQITSLSDLVRKRLVPLYQAMIACMKNDNTLLQPLLKLYMASIDWYDISGSLTILNQIGEMIRQSPYIATTAYQEIRQNLENDIGSWEPELLLSMIDLSWSQEKREVQYLALALLETAGKTLFWRQDCIRRLKDYRKHTDLMILTQALNIWIVEE